MANGTKELYTSPIKIEDEINEFSDRPVKGKTLYKKLKELEDGTLPDTAAASAGDALVLDEDKNPKWGEAGGGTVVVTFTESGGSITGADKTPDEIKRAVLDGKLVFGRIIESIYSGRTFICTKVGTYMGMMSMCTFASVYGYDGGATTDEVVVIDTVYTDIVTWSWVLRTI